MIYKNLVCFYFILSGDLNQDLNLDAAAAAARQGLCFT